MSLNIPPELIMAYALAVTVAMVIVHIAFAIGVWTNRSPYKVLAPRFVWGLATLLFGPLVAVGYWLLHHGLPPGSGRSGRSELL